jgi:hypothetical protein
MPLAQILSMCLILYRDGGLLFASEVGTPLYAQNVVNRSFKPLLRWAYRPFDSTTLGTPAPPCS